ncbi:MAG TPA: APC family permease, partial [Kofleriaceae bacterium]|nr:APC family permease [Kofleriaceae bacterium]
LADWPAPSAAGIAAAISLSVFAFIGFEDLTNMAEEAREPTRAMPRAILLALFITSALYFLVSLAAVRAAPHADLSASEQPMALIWTQATGSSAGFLSAIAVAAALNGVLAQIVMAARVLFGLGRRSQVLAPFTQAHPRFGTPVRATLLFRASRTTCVHVPSWICLRAMYPPWSLHTSPSCASRWSWPGVPVTWWWRCASRASRSTTRPDRSR